MRLINSSTRTIMVIYTASILWCESANICFAQTHETPEREISKLNYELRTLQTKMDGLNKIKKDGIESQNFLADKSLKLADEYLNKNDPHAALLEVQSFVANKQIPTSLQHAKALLIAAKSRQKTGMYRQAARNYHQYIVTAMAIPEIPQADKIEAIRNLLVLSSASGGASLQEFNNLLAELSNFTANANNLNELNYIIARAARSYGRIDLAQDLFSKLSTLDDSNELKHHSAYFESLMKISEGKISEAKSTLQTCITSTGKDQKYLELKNMCRLSLARVALSQKSFEEALSYYLEIDEGSSSFRSGAYEGCFVSIKAGNLQKAKLFAEKFTKNWENTSQGVQISSIYSFLKLENGDLTEAEELILQADKVYEDFGRDIKMSLIGQKRISAQTAQSFLRRANTILPKNQLLSTAVDNFMRLNESIAQVDSQIGEIKQALYMLGRSGVQDFQPLSFRMIEQTLRLSEDNLVIANRLSSLEANLFSSSMPPATKQFIETSFKQKQALLNQQSEFRRMRSIWSQWINLDMSNRSLANLISKNLKQKADLATIKYLHHQKNGKNLDSNADIISIVDSDKTLYNSTQNLRKLLRGLQVQSLAYLNPLNSTFKLHRQLSTILDHESSIYMEQHDKQTSSGAKFLAEDSVSTWNLWKNIQGQIFDRIKGLNRDIYSKSLTTLSELDRMLENSTQKKNQLENILYQQEKILASIAPAIVGQYERAIDNQRSRHMKWVADINQIKFKNKTAEYRLEDEKIELQKQLLDQTMQFMDFEGRLR